jgi:hypothetical protein
MRIISERRSLGTVSGQGLSEVFLADAHHAPALSVVTVRSLDPSTQVDGDPIQTKQTLLF